MRCVQAVGSVRVILRLGRPTSVNVLLEGSRKMMRVKAAVLTSIGLLRSSTSICPWSHDLVAIQLPEHTEEERFPGMTITYALFQMVKKVAERTGKAQIFTKARAHKLFTNASAACTGLIYEKGGKDVTQKGPVILCSGTSELISLRTRQ